MSFGKEFEKENAIRDCIKIISDSNNPDASINSLLKILGRYYKADRVCIFETNKEETFVSNNYEWCSVGIMSRKYLANIDMEVASALMGRLRYSGEFLVRDTSEEIQKNTKLYTALQKANTNQIMIAPIINNREVKAFAGVENPNDNIEDFFLLRTIAALINGEILKRNQGNIEQVIMDKIAQSLNFVYFVDFEQDYLKCVSIILKNDPVLSNCPVYSQVLNYYTNEYVAPEDRERFIKQTRQERLIEKLKKQNSYSINYTAIHSGKPHVFEMQYIKASPDGNQVVVTGADKTEYVKHERNVQKRIEKARDEAENANRAKSEFLSNMSHDIRTPINGIIGMTELARQNHTNPEKLLEYLEKIDISSNYLLSIVNDVLDMSRIESGRVSVAKKPLNLIKFAEDSKEIIHGLVCGRELKVSFVNEGIEHYDVLGDELRLRQVLFNVVSNAVKFTADGGRITITTKEIASDEDSITLFTSVEDTGKGMSKEFLKQIWEPFSQESASSRSTFTGTGLGMSIAKKLIEEMNGEIAVESELGKGSRFFVKIKFEINKEKAEKEEKIEFHDLSGSRVLVAEDNAINMEIITMLLKSQGIEVVCAENGKRALDEFNKAEPGFYNMILMDIMMPEVDGLKACREIRALDREDAATIPIVAMTANAFDEDVKKSLEAGMNAHLSKPIEIEKLKITLNKYIN